MLARLKWFFSDSGGVLGAPPLEISSKFQAYNCRICSKGVWKRRGSKTRICHDFKCFKANGEKWD